jgi:hypothetical protein
MKDLSTATPDKTKQSDESIKNTSGLAPELGSWNTSRAVQHANKTKI